MKKNRSLYKIEKVLKLILKIAKRNNLIVNGIKESVKFLLRKKVELCIIADNCDIVEYFNTIKMLCHLQNVKFVLINDRLKLGRFSGLLKRKKFSKSKYKIIPCSVSVVLKNNESYFKKIVDKIKSVL